MDTQRVDSETEVSNQIVLGYLICFTKDVTALRVAKNNPRSSALHSHFWADNGEYKRQGEVQLTDCREHP